MPGEKKENMTAGVDKGEELSRPPRGDENSDTRVIAAVLAGDTDAFSTLVDRYRRSVFGFALSKGLDFQEAEDAAQETFLRAYRSLGGLREPSRFSPWLLKIASHICTDSLRSAGRRPPAVENLDAARQTRAALEDSPEYKAGRREQALRVLRALEEIDDAHRSSLVMRFIEGKNASEIAEITGEAPGTIRSRIHFALQKIRRLLNGRISPEEGLWK